MFATCTCQMTNAELPGKLGVDGVWSSLHVGASRLARSRAQWKGLLAVPDDWGLLGRRRSRVVTMMTGRRTNIGAANGQRPERS